MYRSFIMGGFRVYETLISIVDHWCSSTFAYAVGDQTEGDENSIHILNHALLTLSVDLMNLLVDENI